MTIFISTVRALILLNFETFIYSINSIDHSVGANSERKETAEKKIMQHASNKKIGINGVCLVFSLHTFQLLTLEELAQKRAKHWSFEPDPDCVTSLDGAIIARRGWRTGTDHFCVSVRTRPAGCLTGLGRLPTAVRFFLFIFVRKIYAVREEEYK